MRANTIKRGIRPIRVLPLGFLCIIAVGTLLLTLPQASADGRPLSLLSALFTATSASCVTGLVVVDTGTHFTLFGQIVILVLIQLGGLGFMTVASILFSFSGKRISLRERMTLAESLGENRLQGVVGLARKAVLVTLGVELIGAALLAIRFVPMLGVARGLWYSLFHSVSAFCNAGFDLIGSFRSFMDFRADTLVNLTLMALVVLGGLGFGVLLNVARQRRWRRFSLHSKIVLWATAFLILFGAGMVLMMEWSNPATLQGLPLGEKVLSSFFQSVTLRTAGFNTIDQTALRDSTKMLGVVLMLIGGAPAGTAGGLKVTTFAVMLLTLRAQMLGKKDAEAAGRRIGFDMVRRALCIITIGLMALSAGVTAVSMLQQSYPGVTPSFVDELYECASALGTVGLSVGVTGASTAGAKALLILMMFMGRVGMLTLALSLGGGKTEPLIRYPQEDIMIG